MPLTSKGKKIMKAMKKTYGKKQGESVFYASKNKGTVSGVDYEKSHSKAAKKQAKSQGSAKAYGG